jgi:hypothetical protein
MYLVHRDGSRKIYGSIPIRYEWVPATDPKVYEYLAAKTEEDIAKDEAKIRKTQTKINQDPHKAEKPEAAKFLEEELARQGYDGALLNPMDIPEESMQERISLDRETLNFMANVLALGDIDPEVDYTIADPFQSVYVVSIDFEDADFEKYESDFNYRNSINKRVNQQLAALTGLTDIKPDVIRTMKGSLKLDVVINPEKLKASKVDQLLAFEAAKTVRVSPYFETIVLRKDDPTAQDQKKIEEELKKAKQEAEKKPIIEYSTLDLVRANKALNGFINYDSIYQTVESEAECPIPAVPANGCMTYGSDKVLYTHKKKGKKAVACCRPISDIIPKDSNVTAMNYTLQQNLLRKDAYSRFVSQFVHIIKWNSQLIDAIKKISLERDSVSRQKFLELELTFSQYSSRAEAYRAKVEYALKNQGNAGEGILNLYEYYNSILNEYLDLRTLYRTTRIAMTNLEENANYIDTEDTSTWLEFFQKKAHNWLEVAKSTLIDLSVKAWNNKLIFVAVAAGVVYVNYPYLIAIGSAFLEPGIGSVFVSFSSQMAGILGTTASILCGLLFANDNPVGRGLLLRTIVYFLYFVLDRFFAAGAISATIRVLVNLMHKCVKTIGTYFQSIAKQFGAEDVDSITNEDILKELRKGLSSKKLKDSLIYGLKFSASTIFEWLLWVVLGFVARATLESFGFAGCGVAALANQFTNIASQDGFNKTWFEIETAAKSFTFQIPSWNDPRIAYFKTYTPAEYDELRAAWLEKWGINTGLVSKLGISGLLAIHNVAKALYAVKGALSWNKYVWLVISSLPYWAVAAFPLAGYFVINNISDDDPFESTRLLEFFSKYSQGLRIDQLDPRINFVTFPNRL